ncbi:MAG TPA: hypothetical protein VIM42_09265 [Clostridium sp.]
MMNKWDKDKKLFIFGSVGTIALMIILTFILKNEFAFVIAFIPYNIYLFFGWRKRNSPKDRKEMYKVVIILLLIPFAIAVMMWSLNSNTAMY